MTFIMYSLCVATTDVTTDTFHENASVFNCFKSI